jgi:hypothetical protein
MQINVGSLTGSTPKFLLLHLEPSTCKNWPHPRVTDAHYKRMNMLYMHTVCERTNYPNIINPHFCQFQFGGFPCFFVFCFVLLRAHPAQQATDAVSSGGKSFACKAYFYTRHPHLMDALCLHYHILPNQASVARCLTPPLHTPT